MEGWGFPPCLPRSMCNCEVFSHPCGMYTTPWDDWMGHLSSLWSRNVFLKTWEQLLGNAVHPHSHLLWELERTTLWASCSKVRNYLLSELRWAPQLLGKDECAVTNGALKFSRLRASYCLSWKHVCNGSHLLNLTKKTGFLSPQSWWIGWYTSSDLVLIWQ